MPYFCWQIRFRLDSKGQVEVVLHVEVAVEGDGPVGGKDGIAAHDQPGQVHVVIGVVHVLSKELKMVLYAGCIEDPSDFNLGWQGLDERIVVQRFSALSLRRASRQ